MRASGCAAGAGLATGLSGSLAVRGAPGAYRGVLAKAPKPIQETRVDLPTIGLATIQRAAAAGLAGIVGEAGRLLVLDREQVIELADDLAKAIGVSKKMPPQVFAIVTVPEKMEEMTANLLAPIVVNPARRLALQVVLEKVPYTTRHRLFPNGFPEKREKEAK